MGRLILTRYNNITGKVEQLTLENVSLSALYIDDYGRQTSLIHLQRNDQRLVQESYIVTKITDQRLVEGIDYNEADSVKKWKSKKGVQ